jgi:hypothetical protein
MEQTATDLFVDALDAFLDYHRRKATLGTLNFVQTDDGYLVTLEDGAQVTLRVETSE